MSKQQAPTVADEAVAAERARIIDEAVREARRRGYCNEFNRIMGVVFPDDADEHGHYRDSDGIDCDGEEWRDDDGFNRAGFNRQGFGRDGFNASGLNEQGFNREGLDADGLRADDPARYTRNYAGKSREDLLTEYAQRLDADTSMRGGWVFDRTGHDAEGFDRSGYNHAGEYRDSKYRY